MELKPQNGISTKAVHGLLIVLNGIETNATYKSLYSSRASFNRTKWN